MKRAQHKAAHPACPHTTWAACELAAKVALGQCKAMVGDREPNPCPHWAVNERGWCGQHYASAVLAEQEAVRVNARKAEQNERIERFIAWSAEHPSVWDAPPR